MEEKIDDSEVQEKSLEKKWWKSFHKDSKTKQINSKDSH